MIGSLSKGRGDAFFRQRYPIWCGECYESQTFEIKIHQQEYDKLTKRIDKVFKMETNTYSFTNYDGTRVFGKLSINEMLMYVYEASSYLKLKNYPDEIRASSKSTRVTGKAELAVDQAWEKKDA